MLHRLGADRPLTPIFRLEVGLVCPSLHGSQQCGMGFLGLVSVTLSPLGQGCTARCPTQRVALMCFLSFWTYPEYARYLSESPANLDSSDPIFLSLALISV